MTLRQKDTSLPQDGNGVTIPITVPTPALARTRDTSISTSTEITFNSETSFLEVTAIDDHVYLKYGTDDVTNANFDEFIHAGSTHAYEVPEDITAINVIDDGAGATVIVIEK